MSAVPQRTTYDAAAVTTEVGQSFGWPEHSSAVSASGLASLSDDSIPQRGGVGDWLEFTHSDYFTVVGSTETGAEDHDNRFWGSGSWFDAQKGGASTARQVDAHSEERPWYETSGAQGMRLAIQRAKRLARNMVDDVGFGAPTIVCVPTDEEDDGEPLLLVEVRVFLPVDVEVRDFLMPYLTSLADELSEADIQRLAIQVVPSPEV